jgi:MoaA/NifB/PqqE/SkfB family radical SAM enzyme
MLGKRFPLSVTFIVTYRCNFKCSYCNVFNIKEEEMTTGQIIKMIDELRDLGMRRFSINGGEPLLREDIQEIINHAKKRDVLVTLFSNGYLVSKNIEKLKELDVLLLSLDGPRQIHDAHRIRGSFDAIINALKTARDTGLSVWTNTVITKNNVDEMDFILDTAKKYGSKIICQPVYNYTHSSGSDSVNSLNPDMTRYNTAIDKLIEEKKRGGPVVHSISYLKYIKNFNRIDSRRCWAGKLYCAITPSGNVAPCYPLIGRNKWSSGLKMGFDRALGSLEKISCSTCYCLSVEQDYFFNLNPEVVLNTIRELR